tara:strand:- start:4183 stop:5763 length:1581 start_codon:yes stop_codon:yes gene_type:complete
MANKFAVEAEFKGVDKFSKPLRKMQNNVNRFAQSADRDFKRAKMSFSKFSGAIKVGVGAIAAGTTAMGLALVDATKTGMQFERAISEAAARFGGIRRGSKDFEAIKKAAMDAGATTEKTATEAAQALNFLAMAGFSANDAIAALPLTIDMATASGNELARTSDILTDSLGSFGLESDDSVQKLANLNRVADVMTKTTVIANTTLEDLFETIKDSAPIASAAGIEMETVNAMAAALAGSGIKATRAATALKNIFVKLAAPTGESAKVLRDLNIQMLDMEGNLRDPLDILDELKESLKGFGTGQQLGITEAIFGKIPLASVSKFLDTGVDQARKFRIELQNANGTVKDMAAFIRDDATGAFDELMSTIEGVKIDFFEGESGQIKKLFKDLTQQIRDSKPEIIGFMTSFAKLFKDVVSTGIKAVEIFQELDDLRFFAPGGKGLLGIKGGGDIGRTLSGQPDLRPVVEDVEIDTTPAPIVEPVIISPVERSENLRNDSTNKVIISPEKGLQAKPDGDLNPNVTIEKTGGF